MERIELWKDPEKKLIDPLLFSKRAEDLAKGDQRRQSEQTEFQQADATQEVL